MGRLGFFGQWFPEKYGGNQSEEDPVSERDVATLAVKMCEDHPSLYLGCAASFALVGLQILSAGSEEQKHEFLPSILSGETLASFCLTEPNGGSNAIRYGDTTIHEDGDHLVLNGSKTFITNGNYADLFYVVCRDANFPKGNPQGTRSVIVRRTDEGNIETAPIKGKIGMRISDTATVFFDDVRVPKSRLVYGREDLDAMAAFRIAQENLITERLGTLYLCVGVARGALKRLLPYLAEERKLERAGGAMVPLQFPEVQSRVRPMISRFVEKQNTLFDIVGKIDRGEPIHRYEPLVIREKVETIQMAIDTCTTSMQLMGGYGIMDEYAFGRLWGAAMVCSVGGGTIDVQHGILHNLYGFPR